MTKEELKKEAIKRVDAFIDTLSQDVRSTLYNRLNQEDVKDFLYGVYIDSAEPRENQITKLEAQNRKLLEGCEGATMMYEHLIKAKDLLLRLSACLEGHTNNNFEYELLKETEQFLNSEVEK